MKTFKKILTVLLAAALCFIAVSCSGGGERLTEEERFCRAIRACEPEGTPDQHKKYSSIDELIEETELAVRVEVSERRDPWICPGTFMDYTDKMATHCETEYGLTVKEVLFADASAPSLSYGAKIKLSMPYGITENSVMRCCTAFPVLQVGSDYVMLLIRDELAEDGWRLATPFDTWFRLEDNRIAEPSPMHALFESVGSDLNALKTALAR